MAACLLASARRFLADIRNGVACLLGNHDIDGAPRLICSTGAFALCKRCREPVPEGRRSARS
ncbi:MAG TPA: hypothetical protein VD948_02865 [Rhodothermales bacterium]|nr:hypothetical protein [Rhodothermales bacterium]